MQNLRGKVIAITGAGSGIGRCLAIQLAEQGSHLSLSDVDPEGLRGTAALVSEAVKVTTELVDVADREQVYAWAESTVRDHGQVDCIINNAGVASIATMEEISYEDFDWVFRIVFNGVLYGTKAFLPHLKGRPDAHIVNISSVNGFVPTPMNGPYSCAKHAVKALNQTLQQELRGSSLHLTSVHPGGVRTDIARNSRSYESEEQHQEKIARFDQIAGTSAERAARIIIRGMLKNRRRLLVGFDAVVIDGLSRLFPQKFPDLIGYFYRKAAGRPEAQHSG